MAKPVWCFFIVRLQLVKLNKKEQYTAQAYIYMSIFFVNFEKIMATVQRNAKNYQRINKVAIGETNYILLLT